MKKLMMLAAVVAALASCQSNKKNNAETLVIPLPPAPPVVEEVEEVFTGTIPSADGGPAIDYVLTLDAATDGVDTVYTLDMTYFDADGSGKRKTFKQKGKQKKIRKVVDNKPKKAVKLIPDDGSEPMYFVIVNDTTLQWVNDSTLQETVGTAVYELTNKK